MTLQLRPTFSESWYRVANLRAKLRAGAQISRQFYRGERWYVVRDPAGNQYHRLSDAAYRFVGLLDGKRTIEEAWESVGGTLEDDAPTQPEVIQILSHLYSANLIDADVTPDATVLLRRHKQLSKRKMQNRLMNILFPRIPLWDPDRFLKRWMPLAKIGFSKFGALVWLAVVISALVTIAPDWHHGGDHSLLDAAQKSINLQANPVNGFYLWFVFVFIKLIHELGHAFSCRRFGGECHELGIMFLVFIPTPYVDASSAWSFRNKWQRIFVGCAGMIVELFFASICAFIWKNTPENEVINQLAFNAMLVASFTTIVFNANPLLRYDGYYILSDWLEIPNLRQKSSDYSLGLIKRHIFGVKLQQPLPPVIQRIWLLVYNVASSIYRTFVGVVIILLVMFQIPILGVLMSLGGLVTWLVMPVFKIFKYLTIDPELHRKRLRATAFTLAATGALVAVIGFIPWWVNVDSVAVAEAYKHEAVRPEMPGFVTTIVAHDHQKVKGTVRDPVTGKIITPGDVILIAQSPELNRKILEAEASVRLDEDRVQADNSANPSMVGSDIKQLKADEFALQELQIQRDTLTIRAPIDGELIAPDLKDMTGRFIKPGDREPIALVAQTDKLMIRVLLEQKEAGMITRDSATPPANDPTWHFANVRLISDISSVLPGGTPELKPQATDNSPGHQVTNHSGEEAATNPQHPDKLANPEFEIDVPVDNPDLYVLKDGRSIKGTGTLDNGAYAIKVLGEDPTHPLVVKADQVVSVTPNIYVPGQKAWVRFKLAKEPLGWQWYRKLLQLLQTKPQSPLV